MLEHIFLIFNIQNMEIHLKKLNSEDVSLQLIVILLAILVKYKVQQQLELIILLRGYKIQVIGNTKMKVNVGKKIALQVHFQIKFQILVNYVILVVSIALKKEIKYHVHHVRYTINFYLLKLLVNVLKHLNVYLLEMHMQLKKSTTLEGLKAMMQLHLIFVENALQELPYHRYLMKINLPQSNLH